MSLNQKKNTNIENFDPESGDSTAFCEFVTGVWDIHECVEDCTWNNNCTNEECHENHEYIHLSSLNFLCTMCLSDPNIDCEDLMKDSDPNDDSTTGP